jgi:hypothetical protein
MMSIGMLWFDNDPKTDLPLKIRRAAAFYQDKYGKAPNLCFVHPCMIPTPKADNQDEYDCEGIQVRANRSILPNHIWIGSNALQPEAA